MTEQARAIDEMNPDGVPRKVLFVAGAGRSGTSTLAGIVSKLGMHVPLPEVPPDDSNPRGFSEPQWVVDVHDEWLREALVQVSDSRPNAWFDDRPDLQPRARPDPGQRVARAALRRAPRARRQGPAAELVPRPVARRRDPHRRDAGLRHDAAPAGRGRRLEAEVLRQQARLRPPRGQLGQHAAPHRARHPPGRGRRRSRVRALRGPAHRLGEDHDRARATRSTSRRSSTRAATRSARSTASSTRTCAGSPPPSTTSRCPSGCTSSPPRRGRSSTSSPTRAATTPRRTRPSTSCARRTSTSTRRPRRSAARPPSTRASRPAAGRWPRPRPSPARSRTGCPTTYAPRSRRRCAAGCARRWARGRGDDQP